MNVNHAMLAANIVALTRMAPIVVRVEKASSCVQTNAVAMVSLPNCQPGYTSCMSLTAGTITTNTRKTHLHVCPLWKKKVELFFWLEYSQSYCMCLLISWIFSLPGYQQPWYYLCKTGYRPPIHDFSAVASSGLTHCSSQGRVYYFVQFNPQ